MFTLYQLEIFIKVVEEGSYSKVAAEMKLTCSEVKRYINKLEEELGVSLFDKACESLTLTKAGELLYDRGEYLLKYSKDVINNVQDASLKDPDVTHYED